MGLLFASPSVAAAYLASPYMAAVLGLGLAAAGIFVGLLIFSPAASLKALGVAAVCGGTSAALVGSLAPLMAAPAGLVLFIIGLLLGIPMTRPGASWAMGCGLLALLMMGTGYAAGAITGGTAFWVVGLFVLAVLAALYLLPLPNFQRALLATLSTVSAGIAGALLGLSFGQPMLAALAMLSFGGAVTLRFSEDAALSLVHHSALASLAMGIGYVAAFFFGLAWLWVPLAFILAVAAGLFLFRPRTRLLILLLAPPDLFAGLGYLIGSAFRGEAGPALPMATTAALLFFGVAFDILLYYASDSRILSLNKARLVTGEEGRRAYALLGKASAAANLPLPRLALVNSESPGLFTVGRTPGRTVVAVTQGLLDRLDDDQLEAVFSHELVHVGERDVLPMCMACALATPVGSAMTLISSWKTRELGWAATFMVMLAAPFFALLMHLSIPRSREGRADAGSARLTGKGEALASALELMEDAVGDPPLEGNPATGPLFTVNPFRGSLLDVLFTTHPPTEERSGMLEQNAGAPSARQAAKPGPAPAGAGGQ